MAFEALSLGEKDIVRQCLVALRSGRLLDEDDIHSWIGVDPAAYDSALADWPLLDVREDDSDACLIINNSLNEVCYGVSINDRQWERWFTVSREDVRQTYRKWARLRGWSRTGIQ